MEANAPMTKTRPFSAEMQTTPAAHALNQAPTRLRSSRRRRGSDINESALVERLKAGDERALESIFTLHSAKLYNVAQRILGDAADAEEVIQDVFWMAFRKANSFQGHSQFHTWLYRLTVNAALGKIRRSKKNKEVQYEEFLPKFEKDGHHTVRPVVDWSDTLEENYAKHEMQTLLAVALAQLKPMDKSVIVLSDLEGLSDKEIADATGLTVAAVKTRLHRARLFLRGKLAVHLGHSAS
jgi:RNA polymerase sigma-70 factor (ECF subfamily)